MYENKRPRSVSKPAFNDPRADATPDYFCTTSTKLT